MVAVNNVRNGRTPGDTSPVRTESTVSIHSARSVAATGTCAGGLSRRFRGCRRFDPAPRQAPVRVSDHSHTAFRKLFPYPRSSFTPKMDTFPMSATPFVHIFGIIRAILQVHCTWSWHCAHTGSRERTVSRCMVCQPRTTQSARILRALRSWGRRWPALPVASPAPVSRPSIISNSSL